MIAEEVYRKPEPEHSLFNFGTFSACIPRFLRRTECILYTTHSINVNCFWVDIPTGNESPICEF